MRGLVKAGERKPENFKQITYYWKSKSNALANYMLSDVKPNPKALIVSSALEPPTSHTRAIKQVCNTTCWAGQVSAQPQHQDKGHRCSRGAGN